MTQDVPAAPAADAQEISVRVAATPLLLFERSQGKAKLEEVWRNAGFEISFDFVRNLNNYVSLSFLERVIQVLKDASRDPDFPRKAGLASTTPEAIGFAYYLLKALGTPRLAYEKTIEVSATFNRVGTFTSESMTDDTLTLSYRSGVPEHSRDLCELRMGQFASIPLIWGQPPATVIEQQCQVAGDDCCRYALHWRNPRPFWRRHLLLLAGLGAGLAALLTARAVGSAAPIGPLVTIMALAGLWLDTRRESAEKDARLRAHATGMEESLREIQLQNVELQAARHDLSALNRDLERRVVERTAELSEAKAQLEGALGQARELDRLKTQFFDNISHELRTPLSLMLLSLEYTLQIPELPDAGRRYLETMDRNADRLLRLVNRLLDLAKLEAGKVRLNYEAIELQGMLEAMLPPFLVLAESKGIALRLEGAAQAAVHVDLDMVEGIFQNLLGNALKFTEQGAVTVRVSQADGFVAVAITDTGPGIAADDTGRIFDRFAQSDAAGLRRFEGSGIGLALVKEGIEIHGGHIEVESQPGQGSTFRVRFPLGLAHIREELRDTGAAPSHPRRRRDDPFQPPKHAGFAEQGQATPLSLTPLPTPSSLTPLPTPGSRPPLVPGASRPRVLLVEDEPETRQFLAAILRERYEVLEASNGREGLQKARKERPVVIVSDVMMPEMSGLQMIKALREDRDLRDVPVVLLTARREVDSTIDGLAVGANDYLGKPFSPRELHARIDVQIRLREATARMAESERLAALGILTTGFAHEVRNPLNGLLNALQPLHEMALEGLPGDAPLLKLAIDCGDRIQDLANSLLALARPAAELGPVVVAELLDSTLEVMRWKMPKRIVVERDYGFDEPITAEPGSLGQVWMNLIDNAVLAMGQEGTLRLSTQRSGDELRVGIADTGAGITARDLPRLFEPFFTTRPAGQGTGLGLALCRRIIDRHHGRIEVHSAVGKGTRFDVYLPIREWVENSTDDLRLASGA